MAAEIGVALLGHGFMGRAHAEALRAVATYEDMTLRPRLVAVAGRDATARGALAARYGFERDVGDWHELLTDDVGLVENLGPNALHAEPTIAAAQAGKHVLCEKPLGRDAAESERIARAVATTGVVAMCGFNYRFVPAVRLARELLEAGDLGEIHHARFVYLQAWGAAADTALWRFDPGVAGSGAVGDLASHVVDLARYLVGEPVTVSGAAATFGPGRAVDDAVAAAVEFEGGAIGTLEATRYATGNANRLAFEINGARGALRFDMERLNELEVADAHGFRRILVTEPGHPFAARHWPHGHIGGWGDTFAHELAHLLEAIAGEHGVGPHGATFDDGHRAAVVCDAILESARAGRRVQTAPAAA